MIWEATPNLFAHQAHHNETAVKEKQGKNID